MRVSDLHKLEPGTYQIVLRDVDFVPLNSDDPILGDLIATIYVDKHGTEIPVYYSYFNPADGTEGFDSGDLAEVRPEDDVDVIRIR